MNFVKFLTLLVLILQIINVKTNRQLTEVSNTITLKSINETSQITFSTGKLLIWPENCILNAFNDSKTINIYDRNLISIDSSQTTSVNVSIDNTDSGETGTCRFHYVNYIQSNPILLVDTGTFKFETYGQNLNLEFDASNNTNPAYYLSINKLGSGDLNFNIQSDANIETFIITDSDPFKVFYINRKNLFKTCVEKEPYNCKILINVIGTNIPFTILIRNAHDNSIATYLKPNEMILGELKLLILYIFLQKFQKEVKEKFLLIIKEEE